LFVLNYQFKFFISDNFNFSVLTQGLLLSGILNYGIILYSNIYRIYNKLFKIAFSQSISIFLNLIAVFIFKGEKLLEVLIYINVFSALLSVIFFSIGSPQKFKILGDLEHVKIIIQKGFYLFIYNASFYFMILLSRTLISINYTITEFGYFTFSYTLANTVLLLLESLNYILYPKIINKFSNSSSSEIVKSLVDIRSGYTTFTHLLAHSAILLFPLFLFLFPNYSNSQTAFRIIILVVIINTNSFGISGYIISKGKEKILGFISLSGLLTSFISSYVLINYIGVSYEYVILGTGSAYLLYVFAINYYGLRLLEQRITINNLISFSFRIELLIPYIISFILIFINGSAISFLIPFTLFIGLNFKEFKRIRNMLIQLLNNPKLFTLK